MGARHKTILTGIALISAGCILSVSVPVFGFICFILLPLPAMVYRLRLGRKDGGITALAGMGIVMLYSGSMGADTLFLAGMVGMGFCLGEFTEKKFPVERIIGFSAGMVWAAGLFTLLIYSNMAGSNLGAVVANYIDTYLTITMMLYRDMGIPEETIRELAGAMDDIRNVLMRILPGMIAAALLIAAWINTLTARMIFNARQIRIISDGPLNTWKTPDGLIWVFIGCVGLSLIPGSGPKLLGVNGLIVLTAVYFFQGIAIVSFYFNKKQVPVFLRVLIYAVIFIQQIFLVIVIGLGFFDAWFNFRRIGAEPPSN